MSREMYANAARCVERMFTALVRAAGERAVNEDINFPQNGQSDFRSSGTVIGLPADRVCSCLVTDSEAWDLRVWSGDARRWCL